MFPALHSSLRLPRVLALAWAATGAIAWAAAPPQFTVEALPEYDALFRRESGWTGADVASTVALSDEVTLWLYGDTWVGDVRDGKHVNATMVNNSVGVQRGRDPAKASVEFFYGRGRDGKPAALITPADGRGYFWLQSGVRTANGLFLFAAQVERAGKGDDAFGFRHVATWLLEVANPDDRPAAWRIAQHRLPAGRFSRDESITFGAAVLRHEGFVYIYGYRDRADPVFREKHAIVARVREADLARFAQWAYYADGTWQAEWAKASRLFGHAASEYSVTWWPAARQFVAVYTRDSMFGSIELRRAQAPEGPWGEPAAVYTCPELKWDKRVFCYAAKAHPELSRSAEELIVTYVANSTSFWHMAGDARLYWPVFLRLRPSAPSIP